MEWCVTFYEECRQAKYINRIIRVLAVFLVLCSAVLWTRSLETDNLPGEYTADVIPMPTGEALDEESVIRDILAPVTDSMADVVFDSVRPGELLLPEPIVSVLPEPLISALPEVSVPDGLAAGERTAGEPSDIAAFIPVADMPGTPDGAAPSAGDNPAGESEADTLAPAVPQEPQEDTSENVIGGFLVNGAGYICGVADPSAVVSGGIVRLPSEGCTGIAAGAFSCGLPSAREIYIPSNITSIEDGAFAGLVNMEWFTVEPASVFSAEMGVLMSEGGTCILAFPAGRIGIYKVPSQITKFANGAFADSRLTIIDATACSVSDTGNVPANIKVFLRTVQEEPGKVQTSEKTEDNGKARAALEASEEPEMPGMSGMSEASEEPEISGAPEVSEAPEMPEMPGPSEGPETPGESETPNL